MNSGQIHRVNWEERMSLFLETRKELLIGSSPAQVLYSYIGLIDQQKVHHIVAAIEIILIEKEIPKSKIKKTFNILVEGLQNMAIHSAAVAGNHYVGLHVIEKDDYIYMRIIGLAEELIIKNVQEAVTRLNNMERADLKSHYLDVMENGELSAKGGAGLGLITMVMKSENGMEVESQKEEGLNILSEFLRV